ncbi:hypothetical protein [Parachryseolinea silvisoli]|uniref:hypothetical protein n=1 Tax=Parachryseolinea silvisoli TaxID=2873601 RepID=UPI002265C5FE|nr:hypothetical protein [Parachryseolinea silvisoli]MCD9017603.1 hypothetical protein [Parachryseolinea silvisoli]
MQRYLRTSVVAVLLLTAQFLCAVQAIAYTDSTKVVLPAPELPPAVRAELSRTFNELNYIQSLNIASDPIVLPNVVLADTVLQQRAYAQSLLEKVQGAQRFIESLDALSEIELPVGVVKSGGPVDYSILIDRMTFTTQGAIMDVYVSLALPQSGDRIAFHGKVPLSKEGGIAGNAKVFLVGDHILKFGSSAQLTIKGSKNTYVEFDCGGFKGVSIEALVQFSRDLIVPENDKGIASTNKDERVKISFTTYAQSLNDLMVGVNVPAFQIANLKGFGFKVTQAFMDWSDLANPPGITFPKDYSSPFVQAGQPLLWQGFYMQRLEVRLPPSFAKQKGDSSRIVVGVEHMILDDQGFSGEVFADNVLKLGNMNGWGYSLDHVELVFVTNQIKGFELAGKISVPNLKKKKDKSATEFGYLAARGADGNYLFSVTIKEELSLPLLVADLTLRPGTSITVKEKENKFYPTAVLNGELSISALSKGPKASFNGISFEGLRISTEAPRFDIQSISFGKENAEQSVSKFPLTINNISVQKDGTNRLGVGFDVTINIAGKSEEEGFGGTAGLIVWGKRDITETTSPGGQVESQEGDWKFDKIELTAIGVNFKKAGVIEIAGMIRFFDEDPVYGDGFKGSVSGKIQVISLKVEALFGKTPEFRYWYADALVEFESGLPLAPGFSAYGFGGGYYSKMKQSAEGNGSPIGKNASGVTYVPDENTIGIKAIVKFGATPSKAPYNGDVMLEVMLNRHGGINSVTFTGNIVVMSPPLPGGVEKIKEQASAVVGDSKAAQKILAMLQGQVSANVKILFDNVNDVFHANMEMYINVGGGIIKGVGASNRAGWAVMHFEKSEWYVLVGTPNDPIGLELLWLLKIKSYFMLGKNLPGSPPPPRQVSEILGISAADLDYMRDLNAAESAFGFAFGINLSMDTGELRFLMFYARFAFGIGSDLMVKKYGEEYHCAGSDQTIGINGWFANGQAYAYVAGKVGIKVKLRFYKGNFDILKIGVAAVLQAKGPNPFWMRGIVGGYYRILGGLVKGNCKFEVTIGKECKIVGDSNPLENIDLISELSPMKGEKDVDVFNAPQAAFNIPVGEVFQITDIEDRKRSFRGKLVDFKVLDEKTEVPGNVRWNEDYDVAAFDSHDVLPPQKELKVYVKLTFEELVNGAWIPVIFEGKVVEEVKETDFTTGTAPDHIPASNVAISYPVMGQFNFYPKEYNQGFISLRKGQPYLFTPGQEWIQALHLTNAETQAYVETTVRYDAGTKTVNFEIPAGLTNDKVHKLEILNIPRYSEAVDANVQKIDTELKDSGGESTLTTKNIEGELALRDVKTVYNAPFRTSKYNTFREKVASIKFNITQNIPAPTGDMSELRSYMQGPESMDRYELEGIDEYSPLVQAEAILTDNPWYKDRVYPLLYEAYPIQGYIKTTRDTSALGMPPVRAIYFDQVSERAQLSSEGTPAAATALSGNFRYDLMRTMMEDYRSMQQQAANHVVDKPERLTERLERILTRPLPFYRQGKYKVRLKYRIPGINKTTSSYEWELYNAVPD